MTTSKLSSMPLSPQVPRSDKVARWLLAVLAFLGLVGFADSAYLLADHYIGLPLPCSLGDGCETVLTSAYAMVGPVPLAAFGVGYYLVVLFFALYVYTAPVILRMHTDALLALALVGFLMSCIFIYIQVFLIGAICMYCALSALCTVLLLAGAITLRVRHGALG